MYHDLFQRLGLSKNEARIYEILLREGALSIGDIATKSSVHRRNVYDALGRLAERGLVFEMLESRENKYQAAPPEKLKELMLEKERELFAIMPELQGLYEAVPHSDEVYITKGIEGWKNMLRDMLRAGEDVYTIGPKELMIDPKSPHVFEQFEREAKKKGMVLHHIVLPEKFAAPGAVDIFADRVIITKSNTGHIDDQTTFTIIVNKHAADIMRGLFGFLGARKNI